MGYACPVCSDPQADGGHLANHLAFTAMLGDDAHESWLDDHAPDWGEMGEADLAAVVVDEVEETEFPQVFEDTVGGLEDGSSNDLAERSGALFDDEEALFDEGHDHAHGHGHQHGQGGRSPEGAEGTDADTEAILEEAREMTREMLEAEETEEDRSDDAESDGQPTEEGGDDHAPDADENR